MNLRTTARVLAAAAGMVVSATAHAQSSFTSNVIISPSQSVVYLPFSVTTAGSFRFYTTATDGDPELFLFASAGGSLGALLGANDDGCPSSLCPVRGDFQHNSLIALALGAGDYTLAVSRFNFIESEAREGSNNAVRVTESIPVVIDSRDGVSSQLSTVPEPSSYALMATGLLGLVGLRYRRRV